MPAQRGFSLIEILVALAIISFVVLGFSAATITVIQSNEISENYTIATTLAQDKLESLHSQHKAGVTPLSSSQDTKTVSNIVFTRRWDIPDPDVSGLPAGVTSIRMMVSWKDYQDRSVTFHTVVKN